MGLTTRYEDHYVIEEAKDWFEVEAGYIVIGWCVCGRPIIDGEKFHDGEES